MTGFNPRRHTPAPPPEPDLEDEELEEEWQNEYEEDFSALDALDDLDQFVDDSDWYEGD